MTPVKPYQPKNHVRIVTAASLFDGHDAAINIMRRILQSSGVEVIHLGHNRSVSEIVDCAIQEDAQGIAITSYQGGHVEYFKYMFDLLRERNANIKLFGGGGGTILPQEIETLHAHGINRIYSPDDGRSMGLQGMINHLIQTCDFPTHEEPLPSDWPKTLSEKNPGLLGRLISILTTAREQKLKSPFFKMESKALLYNIDLSERWKAPPKSLRDIKAKQEKLLFSLGLTPEQAKRYPNWPKYDAKAFAPVAKTNLPVLMLQGGLDPNTPLSRSKSAREAYSGQNQYFIKFPDTPHGVVFNTQVESKIPCGVRVLVDFITNPQVRPSKACLDELPRIDFNPTKLGEAMFGTPSVW